MGSAICIREPPFDAALAEAIGIMLGDGSLYCVPEKSVYEIRIAGNLKDESEYLTGHVKPLFESLFGIPARLLYRPDLNGLYVCFNSVRLARFLEKAGLPRNARRSITGIPLWIRNDPSCLAACIRGLLDTDGSVFRLSNKDPNIVRIGFKNANQTLLQHTWEALVELGFHPSKPGHRNIFLTRKSDTKGYAAQIGFNNPKHKLRFQKFSPVV